jgi:uncharacterized damage-inducible protein DinB
MLAEQIRKLYDFNNWAWDRVFASIHELDETAYHTPRQLFEGSIHATLVHCLSAEHIWLERCNGRNPDSLFDPRAFSGAEEILARWGEVAAGWRLLLVGETDESLAREITYRDTKGRQFTLPLKDIAQHVINHATEHRSQLTPILYFEGHPTEPLDFVLFCRDERGQ